MKVPSWALMFSPVSLESGLMIGFASVTAFIYQNLMVRGVGRLLLPEFAYLQAVSCE